MVNAGHFGYVAQSEVYHVPMFAKGIIRYTLHDKMSCFADLLYLNQCLMCLVRVG